MCLFLSNSPCRFADANAGANCFAAGSFYSVLLASSLLQAISTACCWLHLCCLSLFACWLLIAGRLPAVASSHSVLIAQAASLLPMRCGCCLILKLVLMMLVILLVSLRCLVACSGFWASLCSLHRLMLRCCKRVVVDAWFVLFEVFVWCVCLRFVCGDCLMCLPAGGSGRTLCPCCTGSPQERGFGGQSPTLISLFSLSVAPAMFWVVN